jgi:hypothetical protein
VKNVDNAKEWWSNRSPLTKQQLQVIYYPAINWRYLNKQQIFNIYEKIQANQKH